MHACIQLLQDNMASKTSSKMAEEKQELIMLASSTYNFSTPNRVGTIQRRYDDSSRDYSPPAVSDEGEDRDRMEIIQKNALKRKEHPTNDFETFVHFFKCNIGIGLLALPKATEGAGYILGPIGILIIGTIAMHCMVLLVRNANRLCSLYQVPALDYAETMQFALKYVGAKPVVTRFGKYVVNFFLMVTQFGFCSVYLVFVGQSLQEVVKETYCIDYDKRVWIALILIPIILLSWIRNLDHLSIFSILANFFILFGLGVIFHDEIYQFATGQAEIQRVGGARLIGKVGQKDGGPLHMFGRIESLALFFGNAVFSYESIGIVLPLENKMKRPEHAKYVIYGVMSIVTVLFASFGLIGYLTYGERIQASVTLNLCATSPITASIYLLTKILYGFSIFISYLLQFYIPLDFLEPHLFKALKEELLVESRFPTHSKLINKLAPLALRTILVLLTASLALSIPDLGDLLTLVGAVASSALALIFPPLIHMLTFWKDHTERFLFIIPKLGWVIKDIAIMTLGTVGLVFGTFAALHSIVLFFGNDVTNQYCPHDGSQFQTNCHLVHS